MAWVRSTPMTRPCEGITSNLLKTDHQSHATVEDGLSYHKQSLKDGVQIAESYLLADEL